MKEVFYYFTDGPFNQGYFCPFNVLGTTFASAEQYMMAYKALIFADTETYHSIMKETDYAKLKALGRSVKNFDKETWERYAQQFVYEANKAKFIQNIDLCAELLKTHGQTIVYVSDDAVWGNGNATSNFFSNPELHPFPGGQNLLGNILTKLRGEIVSKIQN